MPYAHAQSIACLSRDSYYSKYVYIHKSNIIVTTLQKVAMIDIIQVYYKK